LLLCLGLGLAPATGAAKPPAGFDEDDMLCPPGRCREPRSPEKGKQGKNALKQVCRSGSDGSKAIAPRGLGEKLTVSAWKALTQAGWHNVTCLEVSHGACPYGLETPEWTVCSVVTNFLWKTFGELSTGSEKKVANVRGLLAPYLAGPGAEVHLADPDLDNDTKKEVQDLWAKVDGAAAQRYADLELDASALARDVLNEVKQDGFGTLEKPEGDKGKPPDLGLAVQQVLHAILSVTNWRNRYVPDKRGWSIYALHLAVGLAFAFLAILMVGIVLWKSRAPKSSD